MNFGFADLDWGQIYRDTNRNGIERDEKNQLAIGVECPRRTFRREVG